MSTRAMRQESLFPTPLWLGRLELDTQRLAAEVRSVRERDVTGDVRSAAGGWQSRRDLHLLPPFAELTRELLGAGQAVADAYFDRRARVEVEGCWANILPPGGFNHAHVHPGAHISGCVYLEMPPGAGAFVMHDPRVRAEMVSYPTVGAIQLAEDAAQLGLGRWRAHLALSPRPGDLVMFPAWLEHSVEPSTGTAERVSVAFNLRWSTP